MSNPPDIDWNNLRAVQDEITRWASDRFPHRTDHHAIHKLMVEEIPEMAMHKKEKGTEAIGTELADCLILLLDLASLWEVDVVDALREKMGINYARSWAQDANGIMQHVEEVGPPELKGEYPCPSCQQPAPSRALTPEESAEAIVQWGNQGICPFDSICLGCHQMFDSSCPF